jgi:vacuolar-type H+-ATPase subunit F/Vma7
MTSKDTFRNMMKMSPIIVCEKLAEGIRKYLKSNMSDKSFKECLELPCFIGTVKTMQTGKPIEETFKEIDKFQEVKSFMRELEELK